MHWFDWLTHMRLKLWSSVCAHLRHAASPGLTDEARRLTLVFFCLINVTLLLGAKTPANQITAEYRLDVPPAIQASIRHILRNTPLLHSVVTHVWTSSTRRLSVTWRRRSRDLFSVTKQTGSQEEEQITNQREAQTSALTFSVFVLVAD